jgi:1-acyl-sn-glycerol-3-phosphate acyltransferase
MDFRVRVVNSPDPTRSYFLAGNHLGILDIFALASVHPALFITSVDMGQTPGLGFLTEMGGCLYVERRNRSQIGQDIEKIREALQQGLSVVLYPEGTSSNGEAVLPFKKSLLVAAAGTGVPVLPMVINYRRVNGEPVSHKWRDHVCWYGDQSFLPTARRILNLDSLEIEIEFCEEIQVFSEEHRREVAAQVRAEVVSRYSPIPVPLESSEAMISL